MVLEYSKKKKCVLIWVGAGLTVTGVTLIGTGLGVANNLNPTQIYTIPILNVGFPVLGSVLAASGIVTLTLGLVAKTTQ